MFKEFLLKKLKKKIISTNFPQEKINTINIMSILCRVCEDYKNPRKFPKESNVCYVCRRYLKSMEKTGPELVECAICHKSKVIKAFYKLRKTELYYTNNICRLCRRTTPNFSMLILINYANNICERISHNIRKICTADGKPITFNINKWDVVHQYNKQNGLCAISCEILTYYNCSTKSMFFKYPNNLAIRMINPMIGYVRGNIEVICIKYANIESSPGTITREINYYIENIRNIKDRKFAINVYNGSTFNEYCRDLHDRLYKCVTLINSNFPNNKINFTINLMDIAHQYYKQNGKCAESGLDLTYYVYKMSDMLFKYPQNMIVRLINKSLGYVQNNIVLICVKYANLDEYSIFKNEQDNQNLQLERNKRKLNLEETNEHMYKKKKLDNYDRLEDAQNENIVRPNIIHLVPK
ncbi:MAG: hypothetical protein QXW79_00870 [Thermoplasmata archaeon]